MARIFLVNPPSPEPVRTPLLSFCHLAASLRAGGHQVALLDASAPFAPHEHAAIIERIEAFAPDAVGVHLKTLHVQPAYALMQELAAKWRVIAGGPHATIVPAEPLAYGATWVIRGEAEEALVELSDAIDGKRECASIAGLTWRNRGMVRSNPARPFNMELDRLAPPLTALDLFEPSWYGATSIGTEIAPGGLLASRGCPAACTFCSNDVTGRKFRYRSAASVAAEVTVLRDRLGRVGLTFLDDSFAVGKRRIAELCGALEDVAKGGQVWWTCTAHPAHLDRDVIAAMKRAGCAGVDIGMESADPGMLVRIGKGVKVDRVLQVMEWCAELDVHCVVNLMFGWPDETDEELAATIGFIERAMPIAGGFNARGVVVPYPGTQVYEQGHERFGFTDWWVKEAPLRYSPFPTSWDEKEVERAYADDPAIDRNFFQHPPHRVEMIREGLAAKASATLAITKRRMEAAHEPRVPAAGAR